MLTRYYNLCLAKEVPQTSANHWSVLKVTIGPDDNYCFDARNLAHITCGAWNLRRFAKWLRRIAPKMPK